ncbi:aspartate/glutamate racemase family protein [Aeromicrobium wangtongii]|uniref:aspartate/glutamate racemase family protein n=1 Tax=Aeromicrobium wangtongii TaxID=2969247 RepID=UPI002017B712|nr:aspartate/glutamate racemase family protein [Aeromicrobium wangtongii]MCL3817818.1 aspartate/glutamate racemase family protein [Aeromicrobium wangtongii]
MRGAPVRILVVNPNSTESMTASIGACARAVAGPGTLVEAVSPDGGPVSIESHVEEALSVPGVLAQIVAGERDGADAFVIACFGDPGLLAARELATGPVIGIAEAAMRSAAYLGRGFSVVTTLERTVGHTWDLARAYGLERHCLGVHATGIPVVELETDPVAYATVLGAARAAMDTDGSDVIVLGCAGMADLCARLQDDLGVPVVDGVAAATVTARSLVELGLTTSGRSEFAPPKQAPVGQGRGCH